MRKIVRKKGVAALKKELDVLVSKYVRQNNPPICYTCGKRFESWKQLQCAHYITRVHGSTRYDLDNLRSACVGCNYFFGQRHHHNFTINLMKELGDERFKALLKKANITKQFTVKELEEMIEHYKKLV